LQARVGVAAVVAALAIGLPCAAFAQGFVEINHDKAIAGGVTAGDLADYPVTIDAPGSYVLTGNLHQVAGKLNVNLIEITASDVVLDLRGFAITGTTLCTASCTPLGSGSGVFATGERVVVRNGAVRGLANAGLRLVGAGSRAEGVEASHNGANGIALGADGVIQRASASYDGTEGFTLAAGGTIVDSSSSHNLGVGIAIDAPATVARTLVRGNADDGIYVNSGSRVAIRGCQIDANGGDGADVLGGFFEGNVIGGHGPAGDFGIVVRGSGSIQLGGNALHANNGGDANPQLSGGTLQLVGTNACGTRTTCP
jgi:hypothetical protein